MSNKEYKCEACEDKNSPYFHTCMINDDSAGDAVVGVMSQEALREAVKDWESNAIYPTLPLIAYSQPLEDKPLQELKIEGECNYLTNTDDEIWLEGISLDKGITLRYKGLKIVISSDDIVYVDITEDK